MKAAHDAQYSEISDVGLNRSALPAQIPRAGKPKTAKQTIGATPERTSSTDASRL